MKNTITLRTAFLALVAMPILTSGQPVQDSVVMGPQYANDVYYSFRDGVVSTAPRANWDIGFQTSVYSATIITNGAKPVLLYTYPYADTAGWSTVDTTGISYYTVLYDSEHDWEEGAFNRLSGGHPDYGWGKYNMVTHDVVGDSIYIVKLADGSARKLWILRKNSLENTYHFKYANIDGSNEVLVELNNNDFPDRNFIYWSLTDGGLYNNEPDTGSWDVVFTRYIAIQFEGTPYAVTGVLNNPEVCANEFHPVGPDFMDWQSLPFDSTKSPIGYDWKSFDFVSGWTIVDSLAYFVSTRGGDVYKLVFTGFSGSGSGKAYFEKTLVSATGVEEVIPAGTAFTVSPNPISGMVRVQFSENLVGPAQISLVDLSGRTVYASQANIHSGSLVFNLPERKAGRGIHLLTIRFGNRIYTGKVMVE